MAGTELGIEGTHFTLNGQPTFLLGLSYYGALGATEDFIRRDLDDLQRNGFNWIRVWATWAAFENDVSAVDTEGNPRKQFLTHLEWLVAECDRRGLVVDVTLSRGNGVTGPGRLPSLAAHRRAVEVLVTHLKPYRNWYLDLANERNIGDPRFVSFEELKQLREQVKQLDPQRLVTASQGGDISRDELREYLLTAQVDFICPHRPRHPGSPQETEAKSREYLAWMEEVGRAVPLHYQEPFRRGYSPGHWEPPAEAFVTDLKQAMAGGAAGWCLHNGDQKDRPESQPRRSFDLRERRLFEQLDEEERRAIEALRVLEDTAGAGKRGSGEAGERRKAAMAFPGVDWPEATPESQGVDSARLKSAVDYLEESLRDYGGARTLVLVRNGYLIWKGPDCDVPYQIFSATKSFTSTCLGLLIDDGQVSLDTRAQDLLPGLAEQYPDVTLRHFATMTSGYDAAPAHYELDGEGRGDSWIPDPPAAPLFPPGTRFRYWDEAMMQFGQALARAAGQPLDELFRTRIAEPIGLRQWHWDAGNWTGGLHTSSRELARFGHLFLNRGNWNGQQLLSASWVEQATSVQVPASIPNDDLPRSRGAGIYGYNWWVNGVKPDGQRLWPDAPPGAYYANGLHSNVCIVVPEWNLVLARTNGPRADGGTNSPDHIDAIWNGFFRRLAAALGEVSPAGNPRPRKTEVSIHGEAFYINGRPTYAGRTWQGHQIEGLLFNARLVQGLFDDLNPETRGQWAYPDTGVWDPERNTREFVAAMPEWRRHGLLAFTLNLQGGNPRGYGSDQPWHNSAFTETGDLRPDYLARLERILDRADELGMVVILGLFYFGQDQRLRDEAAVLRGLDRAVGWVLDHDYRHVLIEVNNECNVRYDHAILQPDRVHELIERVKAHRRQGRRLLVSTSYGGGTIPGENVVRSADFLLLHGNGVEDPDQIAEMVRRTREVPGYRPMPILFNEDDHFAFDQPRHNLVAAVGEYASWGYFDYRMAGESFDDGYQSVPVNWGLSSERKRAFFAKVQEITGD